MTAAIFFLAACLPASLQGQQPTGSFPPGSRPGPPTGPLKVHQLTPSVYWAEGGVGNVGFIIAKTGVVVIDTTISEASARELLADIAKITPKPVTTVLLTHGDIDHVSGLGAFPPGIVIYAQENTRKRMEAAAAGGRSRVPAGYLPNRSVSAHESLLVGGEKLELFHWAPAHTDGDLVVLLPQQNVVFTGDIFALDQPRALIHQDQNGSSEGWITSARGIVALHASRFVVGHGNVQDKQSLEERLRLVTEERKQIQSLVSEGKTLTHIQAIVGDPPPMQAKASAGGPRFTPFSEVVFDELTEKK